MKGSSILDYGYSSKRLFGVVLIVVLAVAGSLIQARLDTPLLYAAAIGLGLLIQGFLAQQLAALDPNPAKISAHFAAWMIASAMLAAVVGVTILKRDLESSLLSTAAVGVIAAFTQFIACIVGAYRSPD